MTEELRLNALEAGRHKVKLLWWYALASATDYSIYQDTIKWRDLYSLYLRDKIHRVSADLRFIYLYIYI